MAHRLFWTLAILHLGCAAPGAQLAGDPVEAAVAAAEAEVAAETAIKDRLNLRMRAAQSLVEQMEPALGPDGATAPSEAQAQGLAAALKEILDVQEELSQFYRDHPVAPPGNYKRRAFFPGGRGDDVELLEKLTGGPGAAELARIVVFNTLQYQRHGHAGLEGEAMLVLRDIWNRGFANEGGRPPYEPQFCPGRDRRAPVPDASWASGCLFIFRVEQAGEKGPVAIARGAVEPVKGVEYRLAAGEPGIRRVTGRPTKLLSLPSAQSPDGEGTRRGRYPAIWALVPDGSGPLEDFMLDETLTKPVKLSGADPVYTRKALHAHVEGLAVIKCLLATDGYLYNCRFLKSLPFMDQAIFDALATRQYQPVTYRGKPINCDYVFNIMLKFPAR